MTGSAPQRFTFQTVFDGPRVIEATRVKKSYNLEELKSERAAAYAEGERSAVAQAEAAAAKALAQTADAAVEAFSALTRLAHEHKAGAVELALAIAQKIAGAALEAFPDAPAAAALRSFEDEFHAVPRLLVHIAAENSQRFEEALTKAAANAGYAGQIVLRSDPALKGAAFVFDWGDGKAVFDPDEILARIGAALRSALEAEALNAEPLLARPTETPQ